MSINNLTASPEPGYIPTPEELVVDTSDFDIFSQLDDLVVEGESGEPTEDVVSDDVTDDGDLPEPEGDEEDFDFDFEDLDDDDLPEDLRKDKEDSDDEDEDDSDEEDEDDDTEDDDSDEDSEDEDYEDEDEEVDYENHEIELPDGSTVTLQAAIEGYRATEALQEERESFETAKNTFKEEAGNTLGYLRLAKLEADRVIEDYDEFDWADLSKKDPQSYVENREFLDKYRARKEEIVTAMDVLEEKEAATEKAAFQDSAKECINTLKAELPGWNDAMYQDLMQYAVENGTSQDVISNTVDASVFKLLHKARQFDLGKQVVKAKIKRKVTSPKKVTKSSAKSTKPSISNKMKIANKLAQGNTSDADIFAALED